MASSAHGGARPKTRRRAPPHYERIRHYNIDMNERNKLGEGATGNVYPAINLENNLEVAAKKITVEKEFFDPDVYEHEFDILFHKIPHHDNIIKMYELFKEEYVDRRIPMIDIWLISEICEQGNLADYAQENDLSSEDKLELFYQAALAVRHLHQVNVVHRDLKPQNILVTQAEESDIPIIKLCDFGTARAVIHEDGRSLTMKSLAGTRLFIAPEQTEMEGQKFSYSRKVDQFSLGVTALALLDSTIGSKMKPRRLNGKGLGVGMFEMNKSFDLVSNGFKVPVYNSSDNTLEKGMKTIIQQMIEFKPEDRPTIERVVESLSKLRNPKSTESSAEMHPSHTATKSTPSLEEKVDERFHKLTLDTQSINIKTDSKSHNKTQNKPIVNETSNKKPQAKRMTAESQHEKVPIKETASAIEPETPASGEVLLVMDSRSVWVRQGSVWMKQTKNPDESVMGAICWCAVRNGIIAVGGYDSDVKAVPYCYHFCLTTHIWSRLPDMITARYWASAVVLGDVMMVLGGCNGGDLDVCEKLHIRDGVWSSTASMLKAIKKKLVTSASGKVFVMPRESSITSGTRMQQYNPTDDRFTWAAEIPHDVKDTWGACLVSVAELLYLLRDKQGLPEQYNPATDQWVQLLSSPLNGYGNLSGGAVVHAGKILLCGLSTLENKYNTIEEYDPVKKQWIVADFLLPYAYNQWDSHIASAQIDVPKE